MPTSIAKVEAAAATHDWPRVAELVHHIKPSLESLGIHNVSAAVRQLEQGPNGAEAEQLPLPEAVARLVAQVNRALQELPQELS
ncbi:Hpt domain-containing protein [Hymenobacter sp. AT01-02]|nr:Hpt domain-containing protein [Hymenobacter sp. AT01-02]